MNQVYQKEQGILRKKLSTRGDYNMPAVSSFIAITAATAAHVQGNRARADQRHVADVQNKQRRLSSAKGAVETIRQSQIARANILQSGENQSVGSSSGVLGGAGSVTSQAGGNINFANQIFAHQQSAQRLMDSANSKQAMASGFGQIANLAASPAGSAVINKAAERIS